MLERRIIMAESKLFKALKSGVADFTYQKLDGTTRHAHGTINAEFIKDSPRPTYTNDLYDTNDPHFKTKITNNGYLTYFDTDKKEIRSFDPHTASLNK